MIGYLEGTALAGDVVKTRDGVGWHVHCPTALTVGDDVEVWVHTHVRDSAITLYGFTSLGDRDLFVALTGVPRVGPAMATALLRDVGATKIRTAVAAKDPAPLTKAAGVGKKAAELIVTSLVVPATDDTAPAPAPPAATELAESLAAMGYPAEQATTVASAVVADLPDGDDAAWLRAALTRLAA